MKIIEKKREIIDKWRNTVFRKHMKTKKNTKKWKIQSLYFSFFLLFFIVLQTDEKFQKYVINRKNYWIFSRLKI